MSKTVTNVKPKILALLATGPMTAAEVGDKLWYDGKNLDPVNWQRYARTAGKWLHVLERDGKVISTYDSGRSKTLWRLTSKNQQEMKL